MNKKFTRIACGALCLAVMVPLFAGCGEKGNEPTEESTASIPHVTSMESVTSVPETNDIPAEESPLANEEFVFGNVFFNRAVTSIELSDTIIDSLDPLIQCPYLETLSLTDCKVLNWTALNSLSQLQNLTISDCNFDNLNKFEDNNTRSLYA